jgi:hypothetical protein
MVFLMQYLDDELCNQICGLLINIHMEDRKRIRKKEIEKKWYVQKCFKQNPGNIPGMGGSENIQNKSMTGFEDLLAADEDLELVKTTH